MIIVAFEVDKINKKQLIDTHLSICPSCLNFHHRSAPLYPAAAFLSRLFTS